jgi:hypothetical protein
MVRPAVVWRRIARLRRVSRLPTKTQSVKAARAETPARSAPIARLEPRVARMAATSAISVTRRRARTVAAGQLAATPSTSSTARAGRHRRTVTGTSASAVLVATSAVTQRCARARSAYRLARSVGPPVECSGACVNLHSNKHNRGYCDHACKGKQRRRGGRCKNKKSLARLTTHNRRLGANSQPA